MFVLDGTAEVRRGGQVLSRLTRGRFIADMSFLTGEEASADVVAAGAAKVQAWKQVDLQAWKDRQPQLYMKLQGVLGSELAGKIRLANLRLSQFTG